MKKEIDFFDKPENIKRMRRIFLSCLLVLVLMDLFIPKHPHFVWENYPGFSAAYGFIACALIIAVAKKLGLLLKKRGDYYD